MKLGLSGVLTRAFINSPLTPLLLLAALVAGALAVFSLPREEEPQISVPMVDIIVAANGYKADEAVELVTRPLEDIIKGIDGVEHVYSQTEDDRVVVTARFLVGTDQDTAVLRVHEKIRAAIGDIPKGIPEPLIVGRGINDVAILVLTLSARPDKAAEWTDNGLQQVAEELQHELTKVEGVGSTYIVGGAPSEIRVEPDPERLALYGMTLSQVTDKLANANRSFLAGAFRDNGQIRSRRRGTDAAGRSRHRAPAFDLARRPARLCQGRRRCRGRFRRVRSARLDDDAQRERRFGAAAGGQPRRRQTQGRECGQGRRRRDEAPRDDQGPHRPRGPRRHRHAQLRRDRQRQGERTPVPPRARDRIDRHPHHRNDRLARRRRRLDHHSDDDPADALRLLDDGLHDQPGQPVCAHFLDRHSRRRRDRRRGEHCPALVDARLARACRNCGRGRRGGRQSDHRRDPRHRRRAPADDVRQRPDGPLHEPDSRQRLDRDAVLVLRRGDGHALAAAAPRRPAFRRHAGRRRNPSRHRRDGTLLHPHRQASA